MGYVYRRSKKLSDGSRVETGPYWIEYRQGVKRFRESTKTDKKSEALQLLRLREGDLSRGILPDLRLRKLSVQDLLANLLANYMANGHKSLQLVALYCEKHIVPKFGHWLAINLTSADLDKWVAESKQAGYANATINRWMAVINRAYHLAMHAGRVPSKPHISKLRERNARQGFFEKEQHEAIKRHLPEYLRTLCDVAYITGWRRSELLRLQWKQVDFEARTMRLEPGETKNGEARTYPFNSELQSLLTAQRDKTKAMQQTQGSIIPWVFHNKGSRIGGYNSAWRSARRAAGCPDRIFHDYRRTAYRNLIRAGAVEAAARKLVGWRGREMPDRYNIVSEKDLRDATTKLQATN